MESLINEIVINRKFGRGSIVEIIENDKIVIKFDTIEENKKFQYPDGFECFLKFEKLELQDKALEELNEKRELLRREQEERYLQFKLQQEKEREEEKKLKKRRKIK